jgi:GNAT superfamily N-acetyltransferase
MKSRTERELEVLEAQLHALDEDIDAARQTAARRSAPREDPPPVPRGDPVRLHDGTTILVRAVAPEDAEPLRAAFRHLGAVSRYRRFLSEVERLTPGQVSDLTESDHAGRDVIAAVDAETGEGVGLAQYALEDGVAHFKITVLDAWQGRGVGTALLERLAARARAAGVEIFVGRTIVGDAAARAMLAHCADIVGEERDGGTVVLTGRLRG